MLCSVKLLRKYLQICGAFDYIIFSKCFINKKVLPNTEFNYAVIQEKILKHMTISQGC